MKVLGALCAFFLVVLALMLMATYGGVTCFPAYILLAMVVYWGLVQK